MTEIYEEKIVPNKDCKYLVDQLFRIIDDDNNGGIDFKVIKPEITLLGLIIYLLGVHGGGQHGCEWHQGGEVEVDVQVRILSFFSFFCEEILQVL